MQDLTDDPNIIPLDFDMSKKIAELLHKNYPGHLWAVTVQSDQGIATVRNLYLSGNWGFLLKLRDIVSHKELNLHVVLAGGELLERYRLKRGKFNVDEYLSLPTNFAGNIIGDKG
ncbi:MAG: hypothetical protein ACWGQW_25015 [bacterium]